MIKVFLFYQRLARKEKLLLLLAGSQALCEYYHSTAAASLTAQLRWAFEPRRRRLFQNHEHPGWWGRHWAFISRQQQEMASPRRGSDPALACNSCALAPAAIYLAGVETEESWQPSQALSSYGRSGRHLSPLGWIQNALFISTLTVAIFLSFHLLFVPLFLIVPPGCIALKLGQSLASGFVTRWIIPLPNHLPLSSKLFTPECLAYSPFKHLEQFTYHLRATVKPTHLIAATSPKGVRIQCLMPQMLTKRRKVLLFEKYTMLNYRGAFHGDFLEWLTLVCLMRGSVSQASLSTHSLSSGTVSFSSNTASRKFSDSIQSPGKTHLNRLLPFSPTQPTTENAIHH